MENKYKEKLSFFKKLFGKKGTPPNSSFEFPEELIDEMYSQLNSNNGKEIPRDKVVEFLKLSRDLGLVKKKDED
jgi:hypothetical protein